MMHFRENRILIFTSILFLLAGLGCTTLARLTALPGESQKSFFRDGYEAIISSQQNVVAVVPKFRSIRSGHRGDFFVAVMNGTNKEFTFSTDNITAEAQGNPATSNVELKIFNYDDLRREERSRRRWAAIGAALQGAGEAVQASNAGYSSSHGSFSGTTYGDNGSTTYDSGTFHATTYNESATQAAQDRIQDKTESRLNRIDAASRASLEELSRSVLKKQTVFPGEWFGGMVKIEQPYLFESTPNITISINFAGETHKIKFKQGPAQ